MKTYSPVASRVATIEQDDVRREGRISHHRSRLGAIAAGVIVAIAIAACTPGSATPIPIGSAVLPSINPSAVASAAAGAAVAALDQVDAAITANQTSAGLTADEAASLKDLATGIRTAIQTGDMTAARTAVTDLSTKVDGFAAKLSGPAGEQLKAAITALKAALPAS